MEQHLRRRLEELEQELESGLAQLSALEQQEAAVRRGLLRISGAIEFAKECLAAAPDAPGAEPVPAGSNGTSPLIGGLSVGSPNPSGPTS